MIPMYFGRSEAPLYGVYHAPVDFDSRQAAVFCYPFGQEYMRAHRAYRQLATRLTERDSMSCVSTTGERVTPVVPWKRSMQATGWKMSATPFRNSGIQPG